MPETIFGIAAAIILVTAVSGRVERTVITIPLLIVVLGMIGGGIFGVAVEIGEGTLVFLELTLALVLFSDASRIDLSSLREQQAWPRRMLLAGLPLTIVLGAITVALVMGLDLGWALLLGVILAPTDAALADPVLTTEELPRRIRQSLNVESGLNDGLALPALFVAIAFIEAGEGLDGGQLAELFLRQLGLGAAMGVAFGLAGGSLLGFGVSRGWMSPSYQKIATVALAFATFGATQSVEASGFVATFVAGMVFAWRCRSTGRGLFEFAENEASALVLIAFLLLGAGPLRSLIVEPPPGKTWLIALLSLFLVRPVSVVVSMIGSRAMTATRLFFGWFGPRGLATVVFLLTAVEEVAEVPQTVTEAVLLTVGLSVLLHGITAYPASMRLVRTLEEMPDEEMEHMAEMREVMDIPMRAIAGSTGSESQGSR